MTVTARNLLKHLIKIIETEGEDCPVYYQLFTYKDVIDHETIMESAVTKKIANKVIQNLNDYDCICERIFDLIDDEVQQLQPQN